MYLSMFTAKSYEELEEIIGESKTTIYKSSLN